MAKAKPSNLGAEDAPVEKKEPEIQFFGEGADKIQFEIDPKARLIRVYNSGVVLVDY